MFTTWKTIKLGTGLSSGSYFYSAIMGAARIGHWADHLLHKPAFWVTVAKSVTEVELVIASVAELGLGGRAPLLDIYSRADELGLDLCPAEVGPQLRLQYRDQSKNERLVIAMEPITDSNGNLGLFVILRNLVFEDDDVLCLDANHGHPDSIWYGGDRFVFLRRK
jgi:hypothetical protein